MFDFIFVCIRCLLVALALQVMEVRCGDNYCLLKCHLLRLTDTKFFSKAMAHLHSASEDDNDNDTQEVVDSDDNSQASYHESASDEIYPYKYAVKKETSFYGLKQEINNLKQELNSTKSLLQSSIFQASV